MIRENLLSVKRTITYVLYLFIVQNKNIKTNGKGM